MDRRSSALIRAVAAAALVGCGSSRTRPPGEITPEDGTPPAGAGAGWVTYTVGDSVFRIEAVADATPFNVSDALQKKWGGRDEFPAASRDGAWLTMATTRFSPCGDSACLARIRGDLSEGASVLIDGDPIPNEGRAAISNSGKLIVYALQDGPHQLDLWATREQNGAWSEAWLLTSESTSAYNDRPTLSPDAMKVLFDCGPKPYGGVGVGVCEVGVDGQGLRRLIDSTDNPVSDTTDNVAKHGDYAADGSIVFEGSWVGEEVWRLPAGATTPALISNKYNNDNSPCVLPSGSIASLWLNRPQGTGIHELKIMTADGADYQMPVPNVDVTDIGLSCHAPPR